MKLRKDDIIRVRGFVMLEKLDEQDYKVKSIGPGPGGGVYYLAKPKGKRAIIGHYVNSLDHWVKSDTIDNNGITLVRRGDSIGNCTDESVVEQFFGDTSNFARLVEEHGDWFTHNDIEVVYDDKKDVHWFSYLRK